MDSCIDSSCSRGAYRTDMESSKEMHQLGKGSFGTVFKAMWLGVEVAKRKLYAPSFPDFEKCQSLVGVTLPTSCSSYVAFVIEIVTHFSLRLQQAITSIIVCKSKYEKPTQQRSRHRHREVYV